jgi:DNA-binding GntR family transcriptional regulator
VVDPDSPEQAYLQVANDLGRRIQAGEIRGRLTSERDLAGEYEVSYGTIRRAMGILRDRGLIVSVHGRGTFATGPLGS